jgi:hypothetical protein
MPSYPSLFANCSRRQAIAVVYLTLIVLLACVYVSLTQKILPDPPLTKQGEPAPPKPDALFYEHIVDRVRGGQRYHDAVMEEFDLPFWREGDGLRPTSIFNWRTPTYAWVLGALPSHNTRILCLSLLALLTAALCFRAVQQSQGPFPSVVTALLLGPFAWCFLGGVYYFTELWAGILIALSVALYALQRWPFAVLAGLAALFFRELTLPYCLLCVVLAIAQRRPAEVSAWVLGLGLYAGFYAWHVHEVRLHIAGEAATNVDSWIRFGGLAFAIATTQIGSIFLTVLPSFFAALMLPVALLGLAGWRGDTGVRAGLTCAGYLTFFLVAGRPQQAYWGLMISPLLTLGLAGVPNAVRDLHAVIFGTMASGSADVSGDGSASGKTDKVTG